MELTISTNREGATATVLVTGEVDVSNAGTLRDAIDAALAGDAATLVVDMADVTYIDSTGIGVLVGAAHRAAQKGVEFVVDRPQHNVSRVLGMLGVDAELNVRDAQ